MKSQLTAIERELVVQYLIDGNVPVTLTPVDDKKNDSDEIRSMSSQIFPVAIKGENVKVHKDGNIFLENPPQSVKNFSKKKVKVEFYFNRVGLFFFSEVKDSKKGLSLAIPEKIERILDVAEEKHYDFSALFYFEVKTGRDINLKCIPWANVELFSRPVWKSIPLENQQKAKLLLEKYVEEAKIEKNIGNGIQLISVCNYLTYSVPEKFESLQDRIKPVEILYVDHERIVLGLDTINYVFVQNDEYGLKMAFSLKEGPIISRDIFVTCSVNKIYKSENGSRVCVDCVFTTIQEEDLRFLYEKATKSLFI